MKGNDPSLFGALLLSLLVRILLRTQTLFFSRAGLLTLLPGILLSALGGVRLLKKKGDMAALALPVTILGGALYHLIFEAKAQYAYPYMVYMLPLAAMGLCALAEKLKKISG